MKTIQLETQKEENEAETRKFDEINDRLDGFHEKMQGVKTPEEEDALVSEFMDFMMDCGPAFSLNVIPTLEGPIVTGEMKAAALLFGITTEMNPDQIKICFEHCADAFSSELKKQVKKYKNCMNVGDHRVH